MDVKKEEELCEKAAKTTPSSSAAKAKHAIFAFEERKNLRIRLPS